MDIRELKAKGGFVSTSPVPIEVEWEHEDDAGEAVTDKFTVHVVRQSFGAVEKLFASETDRSRSAAFIAQCIRFGDGAEKMTYDDAYQLDPGLAAVLMRAINDVNRTGRAKAKN